MKHQFPYAAEKTSQRRNEAAKRLSHSQFAELLWSCWVYFTSFIGNMTVLYFLAQLIIKFVE
jgi:hypothetical protein